MRGQPSLNLPVYHLLDVGFPLGVGSVHLPENYQEDDAQQKEEKVAHRSPVKFEEVEPLGLGVGDRRTILILNFGYVLLDWRVRLRSWFALPCSHADRLRIAGRSVKKE